MDSRLGPVDAAVGDLVELGLLARAPRRDIDTQGASGRGLLGGSHIPVAYVDEPTGNRQGSSSVVLPENHCDRRYASSDSVAEHKAPDALATMRFADVAGRPR